MKQVNSKSAKMNSKSAQTHADQGVQNSMMQVKCPDILKVYINVTLIQCQWLEFFVPSTASFNEIINSAPQRPLVKPSILPEALHSLCLIWAWVLKNGILNGPKKNSDSPHLIHGLWSRQNLYNSFIRRQSQSLRLLVQAQAHHAAHTRHLAFSPESYWLQVLTAKPMAKLLELCFGTVLADWQGQHKHRAFPSLLCASHNSLALRCFHSKHCCDLSYWLNWRVANVSMLCKLWAMTTEVFMQTEFQWISWEYVTDLRSVDHFTQLVTIKSSAKQQI